MIEELLNEVPPREDGVCGRCGTQLTLWRKLWATTWNRAVCALCAARLSPTPSTEPTGDNDGKRP